MDGTAARDSIRIRIHTKCGGACKWMSSSIDRTTTYALRIDGHSTNWWPGPYCVWRQSWNLRCGSISIGRRLRILRRSMCGRAQDSEPVGRNCRGHAVLQKICLEESERRGCVYRFIVLSLFVFLFISRDRSTCAVFAVWKSQISRNKPTYLLLQFSAACLLNISYILAHVIWKMDNRVICH